MGKSMRYFGPQRAVGRTQRSKPKAVAVEAPLEPRNAERVVYQTQSPDMSNYWRRVPVPEDVQRMLRDLGTNTAYKRPPWYLPGTRCHHEHTRLLAVQQLECVDCLARWEVGQPMPPVEYHHGGL